MREEGLGIKEEVNLWRVSKITMPNKQFKFSNDVEWEIFATGNNNYDSPSFSAIKPALHIFKWISKEVYTYSNFHTSPALYSEVERRTNAELQALDRKQNTLKTQEASQIA